MAAEARVLRRTRIRLVAWSAGSTLLVLLAMGGVLYAATARLLAADAEAVLYQRADAVIATGAGVIPNADVLPGGGGVTGGVTGVVAVTGSGPVSGQLGPDPGAPDSGARDPALPVTFTLATDPAMEGLVVGGAVSGTIAIAIPDPDPEIVPVAALDDAGFQEALAGATVINDTAVLGVPMRVLSLPVPAASGSTVLQVASDRTTELRTLEGLAIVLATGAALSVLVAAAFGWLYAGRALAPVRESLRRQREFAADASHELRTPLAVIRGNLELLRASGGTAAPGPAGALQGAGAAHGSGAAHDSGAAAGAVADPGPLEEIDAEVARLSDLVDQLLLLARADSDALELERVDADLGAETADALDALSPVARARGVTLVLDVEPVPLRGDPARLRQLATILVDNAIHHVSRSGGVQVAAHARDGAAVLTVTDDGPGIRPEDLPRVFDRFWRAADAPEGGSGLGLAIAAWIAEQHGGAISAANAPGGGARFEVRLPLA